MTHGRGPTVPRTTTCVGKERSNPGLVRSRTPLAYAGFLIVALVGVIGFAAFSASPGSTPTTEPEPTTPAQTIVSARVAAAVFALEVSPSAPVVATTEAESTTTEAESTTTAGGDDTIEPEAHAVEPSATTAPTTTEAADTSAPSLRITSPEDGATVTDDLVTFEGTTERGARVSSGRFEADVDDDGNWSIQLVVTPGPNGALITARDDAGNKTTVRIVVHYEDPNPTTTAPPATTTTQAGATTTAPPQEQWSPQWPADSAGNRDIESWRALVEKWWQADRVDCALAIIYRESHGNPAAHNGDSTAVGLMQHLLKYWKGRAAGAGFVDSNGLYASPYNGEANIAAGAYLASYYESVGKNWWTPWYSLPNYGSCGSGG